MLERHLEHRQHAEFSAILILSRLDLIDRTRGYLSLDLLVAASGERLTL